jgi:hypothetical protein
MAEARVERRLAAILAADVAGYSRLMGIDEEGTLRQLKLHRKELVDPKITEHRGRIVKTTGDGMLVEFVSVVDAVRCAVDIQRGMADRNVGVPVDTRIELRVGINVGDIISDSNDIFGDGVNVAGIMQRILEYHRFAEDCRKLAACRVNPRHKQKLQEMAAVWDMLAIERKLEPDEKKPGEPEHRNRRRTDRQ